MAMTGMASFVSDILRSRSLVIDLRTEPNPLNGLLEVFGDTEAEMGVAFLLGPNGSRERRVRNDGMPEPAGLGWVVVYVVFEPGEYPMPCGLETLLVEGRRAEAVEEKTLFFERVGTADGVFGEPRAAISARVLYWLEGCGISWVFGGDLGGDSKHSSKTSSSTKA